MLVTETQAAMIAWGAGGLLMVAGVGLWFWARRDERPFAAAFLALVFLGYMVAISRFANGTRVLVVQEGGSGPILTKLRAYGSPSRRGANDQTATLDWMSGRQIIVNDTGRELKLQKVWYGGGESSETTVGAFRLHVLDDGFLNHLGRNDPPPASVASGDRPFRYWLYW